jgi:acyl-CoA thioester hydrolase
MTTPETFTLRHRVRVRFGECDPMDVVYHPNYLVWFHEARDALLRELCVDPAVIARSGFSVPIVEASCRYLKSARYPDELVVVATATASRVARLTFDFQVLHERSGELLATGRTVCVVLDRTGRLLLRLPAEMTPLVAQAASRPLPGAGTDAGPSPHQRLQEQEATT